MIASCDEDVLLAATTFAVLEIREYNVVFGYVPSYRVPLYTTFPLMQLKVKDTNKNQCRGWVRC